MMMVLACVFAVLSGGVAGSMETDMLFDCLSNILGREDLRATRDIKTDEAKTEFINGFWRLRDPIPDTPVNEGRLVYENRCREAARLFGSSDRGARGERGRYWTLLGPPDERSARLFPPDAPGTVGGEHRVVETEHWIYYSLPNIGRQELRFVRLAYSPQFKLAANVDILHGFTSPVFSSSALSVAMADSRALEEAVAPVDAELTLQNLLEQEGAREDFPFLHEMTSLRSSEGMTSLLVTARLRPQDVSAEPTENWNFAAGVRLRKEKDAEEAPPAVAADPFAAPVADEAPPVEADIIVELLPYAKNADLKGVRYYQVAFQLAPGKYTLLVGMVHQGSGKAAVKRLSVDVPAFEPPFPKVSTPVIVRGSVKEISGEQLPAYKVRGEFAPFIVGDEHLIVPRFNNVFSKKANDNLVIYCQVYNLPSESATRNAPYTVELTRSLKMNEPEKGEGGVWADFKRFKPETLQGGTGNAWWFETPAELLKHPQYYKGTYRYEITFKDAADPSKQASTTVEFELTD